MKRYVVGFMFDDEVQNVCMIIKNRPEWQCGLLNGIGGKIEDGESPLEAMVREFSEETGCNTIASTWQHVATLRFPYVELEFFAGKNSAYFREVTTCTDETIVKISLPAITDYKLVKNVLPILELSIQRLEDIESIAPGAVMMLHKNNY